MNVIKDSILKVNYFVQKRLRGNVTVPKINVCGKYLEKAGFKIGEDVQIIVDEGIVVIQRID